MGTVVGSSRVFPVPALSDMKPGRANPKHLRLLPESVYESMEQKRRRLRPELYPDDCNSGGDGVPATACTASRPSSAPHGVTVEPAAMGKPSSRCLATSRNVPKARSDEPTCRNLRRGSASGAIDSFRRLGAAALEAELRKDRVANSSIGPAASLAATWSTFHIEAFGDDVPQLPLTVDIIVGMGSLFKSGGYRSFPNYISDAYAAHVEAGHEWSLLLAHTRTWVTRSVMRGIGEARQSCSFSFKKLLLLPRLPAPIAKGGPQRSSR